MCVCVFACCAEATTIFAAETIVSLLPYHEFYMCLRFNAFSPTVLYFFATQTIHFFYLLYCFICYIAFLIKNIFIVSRIHAFRCKNSITFSPFSLSPSFYLYRYLFELIFSLHSNLFTEQST